MVSNAAFSLQGQWNAAVKLSLCCEQLSMSVAKKEKKKVGPYDSWLWTSLFFSGSCKLKHSFNENSACTMQNNYGFI